MTANSSDQLSMEANERTYTSLRTAWPRGPLVNIRIEGAHIPLHIPVQFLESSGDNTWGLVLHMIGVLVNEEGELRTLRGSEALSVQDIPTAGDYLFVPICESLFEFFDLIHRS